MSTGIDGCAPWEAIRAVVMTDPGARANALVARGAARAQAAVPAPPRYPRAMAAWEDRTCRSSPRHALRPPRPGPFPSRAAAAGRGGPGRGGAAAGEPGRRRRCRGDRGLLERITIRAAGEHFTRRQLPLVRAAGFHVVETERLKAGTVERIHVVKPA
jgi:hypothetical protein